MKLLFATTNAGKLKELKLLVGDALEVVSLESFAELPEVEESGQTFVENSLLKAGTWSVRTGLSTLADDSGLCVDALDGRPGVASARYASTERERIGKLLAELEGVEPSRRRAAFHCALTLALPDGRSFTTQGECRGAITLAPAGSGGFGYDPVFWVGEHQCTLAQLTPEQKAAISHRGQAFAKMRPNLMALARGRLT